MRDWFRTNTDDIEMVLCAADFVEYVGHEQYPPTVSIVGTLARERDRLESMVSTLAAAGTATIVVTPSEAAANRMRDDLSNAGALRVVPRKIKMMQLVELVRATYEQASESAAASPPEPPERPRLSAGERQALALYVDGNTTKQVAASMGVGYETAKTFLRRARAKYALVGRPARKRIDLARRASEDGIL